MAQAQAWMLKWTSHRCISADAGDSDGEMMMGETVTAGSKKQRRARGTPRRRA